MNRKVFLNSSDSSHFPFFFGNPYFQTINLNEFNQFTTDDEEKLDELNKIQENIDQSRIEDTLNDTSNADLDTNKDKIKENLSNNSSDRLRIDPNYKWLLKNLNLNNETRVIDVTDILENNNENKKINNDHKDQEERLNENDERLNEIQEQEQDPVKLFYPENDNLLNNVSLNNTSKDLENETLDSHKILENHQNNSKLSEEYDEDHKNDHNYISKLYERLIKPGYINESMERNDDDLLEQILSESDIDEGDRTNEFSNLKSNYEEWKKQNSNSDYENEPKKNSKFSTSFEVSIENMNNLIDRVDNGIKLKRGKSSSDQKGEIESKESSKNENSKQLPLNQEPINQDQIKIVESLKQEWSSMFSKLENDYKSKLDEQQKLNDLKMKSLHEEIKKCILEQEKIFKIQKNETEQQQQQPVQTQTSPRSLISNFRSTITIEANKDCPDLESAKPSLVNASTSTDCDQINPSSVVDNAKYISNLRMELKSKHARHIQDLKDYYEKEIEDMRSKLDYFQMKYGDKLDLDSSEMAQTENRIDSDLKLKYDHLVNINNELKISNQQLLDKIAECNNHISYFKNENFELSNTIGQMDSKIKYSDDKIQELEENYVNLEARLTDAIKLQDKYVRELQMEKRNLVKKVQENEDLQMNIKYYEQKCDSYELKLDEKESTIAKLKTKLAQTETDLNRLDYEYQKLKNVKSNNFTLSHQQPYIANNSPKGPAQTDQSQPLQLPIRNQLKYSSINNSVSQSNISMSHSPTRAGMNQSQLTILCNSASQVNNNQQLSSSSSSSKSPIPTRSRSPSLSKYKYNCLNNNNNNQNNYDLDEDKYIYSNNQQLQQQQQLSDDLIKYQNHHINPIQISNTKSGHQNEQNEELVAVSSYQTYNNINNNNNNSSSSSINNRSYFSPSFKQNQNRSFSLTSLTPDKQLKYIEQLEIDFDLLMKQKQQLESKLTRLPYKTTNPSMHSLREALEDDLSLIEKKIASLKLEMRKLNIIKTH